MTVQVEQYARMTVAQAGKNEDGEQPDHAKSSRLQ